MDKQKEEALINKYSYMFSEYFEGKERKKKHEELNKEVQELARQGELTDQQKEEFKLKREQIKPFHSIAFGFECDDGWHDLLDELMGRVQKLDKDKSVRVLQVKEKFGGLRFYYSGGGIRVDIIGLGSIGTGPDKEEDPIFDLINEYEHKSYGVCEVCGQPGKLCQSDSLWLKTVCKEHRNIPTWGGAPQNFRPVVHFNSKREVIVRNEYISKVVKQDWLEDRDEWQLELENGEKVMQSECRRIPCNRLWESWIVTRRDTGKEYVVVSKNFTIEDGWTYEIKNEDAIIPYAKESDLEPVKDPETGWIKLVKEEKNAESGTGDTPS